MSGLGPIIILIIVIGGWVIKAIAAMNESKEKAKRSRGSNLDYEELAAPRRAELQQQAEQRRAGMNPPQTQASQRDPSSMTMAERIEMARQRSSQKQRGPAVDREAQALRQAQQDAMRQRRQQEQLRQQQARQQAQQRQQRAQQQQKAKQQQSLKQQRAQRAKQARAQPKKRGLSSIRQREIDKQRESHERVHKTPARDRAARRPESAASAASRKPSGTRLDFSRLNRKSLRQAIILKEVLDAPIALRENHL